MARTSYQQGSVRKRRRSYGTVYELRYRLRDNEKWVEKTEELRDEKGNLCRSDKEAKRARDRRMNQINRLNNGHSATVAVFLDTLWREYMKKRKPSTAYTYNSIVNRHIRPAFADARIGGVTPADITNFMREREEQGVTASALNNVYAVLRVIFEVAAEYGLVETIPVRPKLHRPVVERREKPALTAEQVQGFFNSLPPDYWLACAVAAVTLIRRGELAALRWSNLDFATRTLSITNNLWRGHLLTPKTKGSAKSFQLPDVLFDLLLEHYAASRWKGPGDFIFCKEDGSPLNPDKLIARVLHPALKKAGVEPQPHVHGWHLLRHTGATLLYMLTKDLKLVQNYARHANITTTGDIYVHGTLTREPGEMMVRAILPAFRGLPVVQGGELPS